MAESQTVDDDAQTAEVQEYDFQGTATLSVEADSRAAAEEAVKQYFKDTHGTSPDLVMLEDASLHGDESVWKAVVADQSSGSHAEGREYEF